MKKEDRDIKYLSSLLSRENKRYVIAVANALLFSQNKGEGEEEKDCKLPARHST